MSLVQSDKEISFYRHAHRVSLICAGLHLLVCLAIGMATDTLLLALTVGIPAVAIPWWLSQVAPTALLSRVAMGLSYMIFTGLIVQQTRGNIEAHFSFFVMMSILLIYCDWRTIVAALLTIATHHLVFTILQPLGFGVIIFDEGDIWNHFFVHATVAIFQAAALCYLAIIMHRLVFGSFEVSAMATRISAGDLTPPVLAPDTMQDDMLVSVNEMRERLNAMLNNMRHTAETLGGAVDEIAHGTQDLSARTESDATRTQVVSTEILAFLESSRVSLESTVAAGQASDGVRQSAEQAGVAVGRVVETMQAIEQSSRKISEIIGTIDGIAFQTNILALNAAVEAARAGEQGRGFAVVASEVRVLAQRSAAAAREIRTLIAASSERVATGTTQVNDAGTTMSHVVASVRSVGDLIQEAAMRAKDERPRIEQLAVSLHDLDTSMQQNAAFVEQLSATTIALRDQEQALRNSISTFLRVEQRAIK